MTSALSPSSDVTDALQKLQSLLRQSCNTLNGLIAVIVGHDSAVQLREETTPVLPPESIVLTFLIPAAGSSTNTLISLSDSPGLQTRDCYSIARSIVEISVNICYIMGVGNEAAERAIRHARYKFFTGLNREGKIGDEYIKVGTGVDFDPSSITELRKDIEEFLSNKGREKPWTSLSINDRIDVVGQHFTRKVMLKLFYATFMIYRHSSEILHGSFYGANYFAGNAMFKDKSQTISEWAEDVGTQHMLLLFSIVLVLSAIIEAFHEKFGFSSAYNRSKETVGALYEIKFFKDRMNM